MSSVFNIAKHGTFWRYNSVPFEQLSQQLVQLRIVIGHRVQDDEMIHIPPTEFKENTK